MISIQFDNISKIERAYSAKEQLYIDNFNEWVAVHLKQKCNYQLHQLPNGGKIMFPISYIADFMPVLDKDNNIIRMRSNHEVAFIFSIIITYSEQDLENFYLLMAYYEGLSTDIQRLLMMDKLLKGIR